MAAKTKNNPEPKRRVNFVYQAQDANEVYLVGDFNQWNETAHAMKKDSSGLWKKTVMLMPGLYEYKFLVDGQWKNDPANDDCCENAFGTTNSRIQID
ncbi:MAG: isoamylase early set domain-containing protein [Thermodesulfobacteriota bacterium]